MTDDELLTRFRNPREPIVSRVKGAKSPSVQVPYSSEEDIVVRERVPIRNQRPEVIEPGTNGNHAPIGQAQNNGYSDNIQEIHVSMENVHPEGTEE